MLIMTFLRVVTICIQLKFSCVPGRGGELLCTSQPICQAHIEWSK